MDRCDRLVALKFDDSGRVQRWCQLPVGHVGQHRVYFAIHDGAHESPVGGSFVEWDQVDVAFPGPLQHVAAGPS